MKTAKIVVIFDWDDTLLDAGNILSSTQEHALKDILKDTEKYPFTASWKAPSKQDLYQNAGHRFKEKILPIVMPDYDETNPLHGHWADDVFNRFKQYYLQTSKTLFPGIKDMLTHLKQEGFILAIATNKSKDLLYAELDCSKLYDFFEVIMTGDDPKIDKKVKPHPEMINLIQEKFSPQTQFCMVGDRPFDMQAAKSSIRASQTTRIGIESHKDCELDAHQILSSAAEITSSMIKNLLHRPQQSPR